MKILPGIKIMDKALWLEKKKVLIVADFHLGYEEALNKQGILVPRIMFKEISKELNELFRKIKVKPKTIVINGDLKHEFGQISEQEWNESFKILDLLMKKCKNIVLIKGNHDTILGPIAKRKGFEIKDFYCIDNICILHGHKIFLDKKIYDKKFKILIIAHEHPAVSLREGTKQEIFKCFLLGRWKSKKLIVMPSFFTVFEGSDVKREKLLSPYLSERTIRNFDVFIVADKVYKFGKLKNI